MGHENFLCCNLAIWFTCVSSFLWTLFWMKYIGFLENKFTVLRLSWQMKDTWLTVLPIFILVSEVEASPVRCLVSDVRTNYCGADFTVWLTPVEGSTILYGLWIWFPAITELLHIHQKVLTLLCICIFLKLHFDDFNNLQAIWCFFRTAGLPQYGQLGHGTDNEVWVEHVLSPDSDFVSWQLQR